MTTAYEVSIRLGFWGDSLEPETLIRALGLSPSFCDSKVKGEVLKRPNGTPSGSVAKTGRVIYNCDKELEKQWHSPVAQLERIADVLRPLPQSFFSSNGVEEGELQISVYYNKNVPGEPDFFVPTDLVPLVVLHAIRIRLTVLP